MVHPRIKSLPIGVDYHTIFFKTLTSYGWDNEVGKKPIKQEQELYEMANKLPLPVNRIPIAYTSSTLNITDSREKAHHSFFGTRQKLKEKQNEFEGNIVFENKQIKRQETWKKHGDYLFIVSPPGAGIDCHRTWEALILKNIVIVLRTPPMSDDLFERLPVIVIDDISEITIENMKAWREDYLKKFANGYYDYTRVTKNYWLGKIKEQLLMQ